MLFRPCFILFSHKPHNYKGLNNIETPNKPFLILITAIKASVCLKILDPYLSVALSPSVVTVTRWLVFGRVYPLLYITFWCIIITVFLRIKSRTYKWPWWFVGITFFTFPVNCWGDCTQTRLMYSVRGSSVTVNVWSGPVELTPFPGLWLNSCCILPEEPIINVFSNLVDEFMMIFFPNAWLTSPNFAEFPPLLSPVWWSISANFTTEPPSYIKIAVCIHYVTFPEQD